MKLVNLSEFQRLTGISDRSLLWLLKNRRLICQVSDASEIMIDIESADVKKLIEAMKSTNHDFLKKRQRIITEKFARIIGEELDVIVDQAVARLKSRN
ncbi:MAG: hypothetical protein D6719_03200 [Candidatus Dadabacteria bacterium]|nr:MAG: hypothetical protein D6719_03200 [Candidatus Dadabacteria bacterium]